MTSDLEVQVNQEAVVRHYRAATRAEVEQAYRAEAAQAAQGGYLPVTHQWSQDQAGFLLAVGYAAGARPPAAQAAQPQAVGLGSPTDRFVPAQPLAAHEGFAPAGQQQPLSAESIESQWLAPEPSGPVAQPPSPAPERYVPPPEMYLPPADMYAPAQTPIQQAPPTQPTPPMQQAPPTQPVLQWQPAPPVPARSAPAWYSPSSPPAAPVPITEPPHISEPPHIAAAAPSAPPAAPPAPSAAASSSAVVRHTRMTLQTMDLHCAGEPLRIIRSGFPDVPNLPVLERRAWVKDNADHIRRTLIQEPRGHRDMYGAILLPPYNDYADMCVLFMHNEGYSTMCGHGIIAITTGLIEEGLYPASAPVTTIRYEVPAGIVAANAATIQAADGSWSVQGVRFTNVPSYLAAQSLAVRPDGIELHGNAAQYGALSVDLAFGGAYYGIVNAAELGLRVVPEQADALRRAGAAITEVLRRDHTPSHPTDAALSFVYGTIIVDLDPRSSPDGLGGNAHIRNATIFADAELDRSPCGSGTSAILAQLHARGRIKVGQEIVNAGITGEHFLGRVEAETALGPFPAVSTSIAGTAYVTGYSTFVVDDRDPLAEGFLLR